MSTHYAELVNQSEDVISIKNKDCQVSLSPKGSSLIDKITYDSLITEIKVFMVLGKVKINLNNLEWNLEVKKEELIKKEEANKEVITHDFVPGVTISAPKKEFKKEAKVKLNLDK